MAALFRTEFAVIGHGPAWMAANLTGDSVMQTPKAASFFKAFGFKHWTIAAIGLGSVLCVSSAAEAQFYGRGWDGYGPGPYDGYRGGPYGGGPYGTSPYADYDPDMEPGQRYHGPRYDDGSVPPSYRRPSQADQPSQTIISIELIKRRIKAAGFRLIATPRHKGNIYLAEVEDGKAVRHRLVYDAHDGHLVENTSLGPIKKLLPR